MRIPSGLRKDEGDNVEEEDGDEEEDDDDEEDEEEAKHRDRLKSLLPFAMAVIAKFSPRN